MDDTIFPDFDLIDLIRQYFVSVEHPSSRKTPSAKFDQLSSEVVNAFNEAVQGDYECPIPMGVVIALTKVITLSSAKTMLHLKKDLKTAMEALKKGHSHIGIQASCELFKRYVTRTWLDLQDFDLLKEKLLKRGEQFKFNAATCTAKIARLAISLIRDGMVVLTHGYSAVVLSCLLEARASGTRFSVIITSSEGRMRGGNGCRVIPTETKNVNEPADEGKHVGECATIARALLDANIPVTVASMSSVAYSMTDVDLVLVGATAVVENGGVLHTVGTYQISLLAHTFQIPCYVTAQSFQFTRIYPLTQKQIPDNETPVGAAGMLSEEIEDLQKDYPTMKIIYPSLDYTPPSYLTLLCTDLGILTPSAVSDELIKLYS